MKLKKTHLFLLFTFIIINFNTYSYANAGTALMWAVGFHLYIANIIISILESIILWKFFSDKKYYQNLILMLISNYFSMLIGFYLSKLFFDINKISYKLMSEPKTNEPLLATYLLVISFIISLITEFPFIYFLTKNKTKFKHIIFSDVIINSISYFFLIIIYIFFLLL